MLMIASVEYQRVATRCRYHIIGENMTMNSWMVDYRGRGVYSRSRDEREGVANKKKQQKGGEHEDAHM